LLTLFYLADFSFLGQIPCNMKLSQIAQNFDKNIINQKKLLALPQQQEMYYHNVITKKVK